MAIGYSVLIKDKKLTKEILIKKFEEMGYTCDQIEDLPKGINIDLNAKLGYSVYLIDAGSYPYNGWQTNFTETEFVFERTLGFRFDKEYEDLEKRYKTMLSVIFDLILDMNEEAIFISNGDTELCMFEHDKKICLNNKSEIWNRNYFKDVIVGKNVSYFVPR